jgi:hypothetical protein
MGPTFRSGDEGAFPSMPDEARREAPASAGGASNASFGEAGAARSDGSGVAGTGVEVAAMQPEQPVDRASLIPPSASAEATADKRASFFETEHEPVPPKPQSGEGG